MFVKPARIFTPERKPVRYARGRAADARNEGVQSDSPRVPRCCHAVEADACMHVGKCSRMPCTAVPCAPVLVWGDRLRPIEYAQKRGAGHDKRDVRVGCAVVRCTMRVRGHHVGVGVCILPGLARHAPNSSPICLIFLTHKNNFAIMLDTLVPKDYLSVSQQHTVAVSRGGAAR